MTRPGFLEGAMVALIVALAAATCHDALDLVLSGGSASRLLVPAIALAYLLYLQSRSTERVGRVTTLAGWGLSAALLWVLHPPLSLYLLAHAGLISVLRSLYFHQGPLTALADLGLTGLGLIAAAGAWLHTGSLFIAVWTLFLIQALFCFVPRAGLPVAPVPEDDRFERAHRSAEAALRQLTTTRITQ
jgi:hypothetical protein